MWASAAGRIGQQEGRYVEFVATPQCTENTTCNVVLAIDDVSLDNCLYTVEDFGCNFDNFGDGGSANGDTFCHWKQDQEDDIDWILTVQASGNESNADGFIRLWNSHEESQNGALYSSCFPKLSSFSAFLLERACSI